MISVTIIGKGNVGTHLYNQFRKATSVDVLLVDSRNLDELKQSDITIIAVSDGAIPEVSSKITNPFVVHTSGNVSMEQLKNKTRKGVLYPLQSFTKEKEVDFTKVPFCIETESSDDLVLLDKLVACLGAETYHISSSQRKNIHLAAVFANNFTNHMYKISRDICDSHQIPFEILIPLIEETASKIRNLSPLEAQTGPAVRNDTETIKNHLNLLSSSQKEIYQLLTESIRKHGKKL